MKSWVKRFAAIGMIISVVGILAGCGNEETMGTVDMNKVMQQSTRAKTMQQQMEQKRDEINARLDKEKQSLSAEDFKTKQDAAQQEWSVYSQSQQKQFISYAEAQMATIAKDKKLGVVVVKDAVHQGGVDVTDDLIQKMQ